MDPEALCHALGPGDGVLHRVCAAAVALPAQLTPAHLAQPLVYAVPFLVYTVLLWRRSQPTRRGLRSWFAFAFPWSLYRHRSSRVDLKVMVGNLVFIPAIGAFGALLIAAVASGTSHLLGWISPHDGVRPEGGLALVGFTVVLALVYDFATFVTHYLHHRVPWMWELHKLHHSAEVLTPMSAFRHHPAYLAIDEVVDAAIVGPALGVTFWWFGGPVDPVTVFGTNLVYALFQAFGGGLRHSHLWMSLGPGISRILISPAMHQVHHSVDPKHYDRNFGEIFAIWDLLFGTLYVPREREEIVFGVGEPSEHTTLRTAWWMPLRRAWEVATRGRLEPQP